MATGAYLPLRVVAITMGGQKYRAWTNFPYKQRKLTLFNRTFGSL
jgi:hypothetical protein